MKKITIDPTSAGTRQIVVPNDEVTNGRRCYVERFEAHYDGQTAWSGDATELYIESTSALGDDRFATIPIASMSTTRATTQHTEGVVLTPLMFASEGGVASLGVSVIADDDAASGSDIVLTLWIRVSIFPSTDSPSSADDKTITSPQTVQSDLSVASHTYDLWRFGRDFLGDVTTNTLHAGFTGHTQACVMLLPCPFGDDLQSVTLHYEQTAGSGTTATISLLKINIDDGTTAATDATTGTLSDTAGTHSTTVTPSTLTALGDGECFAIQIATNSSGNSDWVLLAAKANIESTKVQYDRVI